jgi:hypothetical protein
MLKLMCPSLVDLYVCYVYFSSFGLVNNVLPALGKTAFPGAVLFALVSPPRITGAAAFVGPAAGLEFAAPIIARAQAMAATLVAAPNERPVPGRC